MSADRDAFLAAYPVSRETGDALDAYADLLRIWQRRINLVGASTLETLWIRHFLDSAQLLPHIESRRPDLVGGHWLDIGSGAGFPGLVLAILGAGTVDLVESDARKCAFLGQVVRATGAPARIRRARVKDLAPFPVDIVTARAVAPVARLLEYARPFLAPGGEIWLLKGAGASEELTRCRQSWTVDAEIMNSRTDDRGRLVRIRTLSRVQTP